MKKKVIILAKTRKGYWETKQAASLATDIFFADENFSFIFGKKGFGELVALFIFSVVGFIKSKKYDLVITADPRVGEFLGFLKGIFGSRALILVDQLIMPDSSEDFLAKIKERVTQFSFRSIDAAIVNSESEKKDYSDRLKSNNVKFFFVPIFVEDRWIAKDVNEDGNYIFSGGGALRDFRALIDVAKRTPFKFKIVSFQDITDYPPNCKVEKPVEVSDYLAAIDESLFVVVPLVAAKRAAGQTTVIQTMARGKAVVVSDIPSIRDYIRDNTDGLLVKAEERADLSRAINRLLHDKKLRDRLARNGYKRVKERFHSNQYHQRFSKVIEEVLDG